MICQRCQGDKVLTFAMHDGSTIAGVIEDCPDCNGTGETHDEWDECWKDKGLVCECRVCAPGDS